MGSERHDEDTSGASGTMTMTIRSGPWDAAAISTFLADTVIPIRIASAGRTAPLVQSLWFLYAEESLWCCTQSDALLARRLAADPRCGFEVSGDSPPYRGVRGHGRAEVLASRATDVLPALIDRYLGETDEPLAEWLLSRLDSEVAVRIHTLTVTSFDYSPRMAG